MAHNLDRRLPEHRRLPEQRWAVHGGLILAVAALCAVITAAGSYAAGTPENGLVENLQLLILLVASSLFLYSGAKQVDNLRRPPLFAFAVLCVAFFLREFDGRSLPLPGFASWLLDGPGRLLLILPTLLLIYPLWRSFQASKRSLFAWIHLAVLAYLTIGALTLFAGWPLDRSYIRFPGKGAWEEGFELAGYTFVLVAAGWSFILGGRTVKSA